MLARIWLFVLLFVGIAAVCGSCTGRNSVGAQNQEPALYEDIQATATPDNVDPGVFQELQNELVRVLAERGISKVTATPPQGGINSIGDLVAADLGGGAVELSWTHFCSGDYNNDGEVTVSDMTPVGIYYNASSADANWPLASAADGNSDGFITVSDITPIGQNFGVATRGYTIYSSADPADCPADVDGANGPGTMMITGVQFSTAATNAFNRREFSYTVGMHNVGAAYWVRPFDGAFLSGVRSIRAVVGAAGNVDLEVHLASANQPTGGSGTAIDPYLVDRITSYDLQLVHTVDGDVTSHAGTTYQSNDLAASVDATGQLLVGALANDFTITGTYNGVSDNMYCLAQGSTGQVTYSMHPTTPALGGTGTMVDPFQIDAVGNFALQVVDTQQAQDVTGQAIFTVSDQANIQVDPTGLIVVEPAFGGNMNIVAEFQSQSTTPGILFFNVVPTNQNPTAQFLITSGISGIAPFDLVVDATSSSDPDGSITQYEWDMDGNGSFEYSTTEPVAEHSYGVTFHGNVSLRVTDNLGATGEVTHPDTIDVTDVRLMGHNTISSRGLNGCCIAEIDGVPNIALTGDNYVDYYRGSDAVGTAFPGFTDLDSTGVSMQGHRAVGLASYLTYELLVYAPSDLGFDPAESVSRMVMALNGDGTGWESIGTTVDFYSYQDDIAIHSVDNGINVYQVDENMHLLCFRSTDGGSSFGSFYTVEGDFSLKADFAVSYLDVPIAAYAAYMVGYLYYRRADDSAGTTWSSNTQLIHSDHNASSVQLEVFNGKPCIAYVDCSDVGNGQSPIYFCSSNDANGTVWSAPVEIANPGWTIPRKIAMTSYLQKPVVAYQSGNDLVFQRAHDRKGSRWCNVWAAKQGIDTRNISMCQVEFNLCIAYNTTTDGGATSAGTVCSIYHD